MVILFFICTLQFRFSVSRKGGNPLLVLYLKRQDENYNYKWAKQVKTPHLIYDQTGYFYLVAHCLKLMRVQCHFLISEHGIRISFRLRLCLACKISSQTDKSSRDARQLNITNGNPCRTTCIYVCICYVGISVINFLLVIISIIQLSQAEQSANMLCSV